MAVIEIRTNVDVDLSKYCMSLNNSGYVAFFIDGQCMLLHGMIMGLKPGDKMTVDHIDGDKLNNVRANSRFMIINKTSSTKSFTPPTITDCEGWRKKEAEGTKLE